MEILKELYMKKEKTNETISSLKRKLTFNLILLGVFTVLFFISNTLYFLCLIEVFTIILLCIRLIFCNLVLSSVEKDIPNTICNILNKVFRKTFKDCKIYINSNDNFTFNVDVFSDNLSYETLVETLTPIVDDIADVFDDKFNIYYRILPPNTPQTH